MTGRTWVAPAAWLGLAALMGLLAGCGRMSMAACPEPPKEIMQGGSIPPLEAPVGLETPDTSQALRVPDLAEPEKPRTRAQGCLDEPPSYFPDRRVGAERENPAGKK